MNAPKTKAKTPRPVESFGPEILAALIKGATEPVRMTLSYKVGTRLRMRIHQLREAMRKSGHEKYNLVARVVVTVRWPSDTPTEKQGRYNVPIDRNTKCEVKLQANDLEFADELRAAGVDIGLGADLEPTATLVQTSDGLTSTRTLEDLLKGLGDD